MTRKLNILHANNEDRSHSQAWAKRPLIISGPCSAETEEQVLQTAQRLATTGK